MADTVPRHPVREMATDAATDAVPLAVTGEPDFDAWRLVVDDVRAWYDDRARRESPNTVLEPAVMVANRPVWQAPDGVVDDRMYLIGERAVVTSPLSTARVVVREPNGVAVVRL